MPAVVAAVVAAVAPTALGAECGQPREARCRRHRLPVIEEAEGYPTPPIASGEGEVVAPPIVSEPADEVAAAPPPRPVAAVGGCNTNGGCQHHVVY
jgi:hypothetical protein